MKMALFLAVFRQFFFVNIYNVHSGFLGIQIVTPCFSTIKLNILEIEI